MSDSDEWTEQPPSIPQHEAPSPDDDTESIKSQESHKPVTGTTDAIEQELANVKQKAIDVSYRSLVRDNVRDTAVQHAQGDLDDLGDTYIGLSLWTRLEKSLFFFSLDRHGPIALDKIAADVRTKTTTEVRAYIEELAHSLQDALERTKPPRALSGVNDERAAFEIGEDCEVELDSAAIRLEQKLHNNACRVEQERYGDDWIIDTDRADTIHDSWLEQDQDSDESGTEDSDLGVVSNENDTESPANLLREAALIALMRNVFMNDNKVLQSRWDQLPVRTIGAHGPAILRSAYDMLHELCVSYTRRLVQAAHFQALTRIRTRQRKADGELLVRSVDVAAAIDITGSKQPSRLEFWQRALQQYQIDVYGHAKRFATEDRPRHFFIGYKLTQEELRTALARGNANGNDRETVQPSADLAKADITGSDNDDNSTMIDEVDGNEEGPEVVVDPTMQMEMLETQYLEAYDAACGREEENELRQLLILPKLEEAEHIKFASRPIDKDHGPAAAGWKSFPAFRAAWEAYHHKDFKASISHETSHKRRRLDTQE